jgi:transcriptional regulator with XRE-family HTH domain
MDKNDILIEFGNNLRAERSRKKLSQDELANLADICDAKHIGNIENGKINTQLTTIVKILKALKINFDDLLKIK